MVVALSEGSAIAALADQISGIVRARTAFSNTASLLRIASEGSYLKMKGAEGGSLRVPLRNARHPPRNYVHLPSRPVDTLLLNQ